MLEKYNIYL